jgi:basic amino acid/polyamine antiporter, APA family
MSFSRKLSVRIIYPWPCFCCAPLTFSLLPFCCVCTHSSNLSSSNAFQGTDGAGIGPAMISALWAYDGWSNLAFLAEELIDFERRLPLIITSAVFVVMGCYVLANISYLAVLTQQEIVDADAIGIQFGTTVGGDALGIFFALGVAFSAAGSTNGSILTGGRAFYATGRAGMFPSCFGWLNAAGAPWVALCAQSAWAIILILIPGSDFSSLLDYFGPASWLYYAFTASTVIYFRMYEPDLARPFKVPLYPLPPVLLILISLGLVVNSLIASPLFTLLALGFIALSAPVYLIAEPYMSAPPTIEEKLLAEESRVRANSIEELQKEAVYNPVPHYSDDDDSI